MTRKAPEPQAGSRILIDFLLPAVNGEFIAFCEGDDYWIDHLKLQTQVNLLRESQKYSFSAHNTYENNKNTCKV